jgi:protein TonB
VARRKNTTPIVRWRTKYCKEHFDARKAKAERANQRRIQVSGVEMERRLLRKVEPSYPRLAIAAGIEGVVHFIVIVGTDGRSEHIQLTSGHPLLVEAARDAVKQYIYEVPRVNGEPVEVVTSIEIPFRLP